MQPPQELAVTLEEETLNSLPPLVSINLREKFEAQQVYIDGITQHIHHRKSIHHQAKADHKLWRELRPRHALQIIWCPDDLDFEVDDVDIVHRLRIWNPCSRSIYIHCCGLWGETCRLGAYWRCYPRTRFLLVPGLSVAIYVKATPREYSPIPHASIALQLAAAYKSDHVIGLFAVPIRVRFLNYIPPSSVEREG